MKSLEELAAIRNRARAQVDVRDNNAAKRIVVGMATCGIASGARPVLQAIIGEVADKGLSDVVVSQSGCIGKCELEPIVEVFLPGQEKLTYVKVHPEMVPRIVEDSLIEGRPVTEYTMDYYEEHSS